MFMNVRSRFSYIKRVLGVITWLPIGRGVETNLGGRLLDKLQGLLQKAKVENHCKDFGVCHIET